MAEKTECKYGAKCYRKSKDHLDKFRHPANTKRGQTQLQKDENEERAEKRPKLMEMAEKVDQDASKDLKKSHTEQGQSSRDEESPHISKAEDRTEESPGTPDDVNPSEHDIKETLMSKFKVQIPQDFYDFWDYCKNSNPTNPCAALQDDLGLRLGGPFNVMAGRLKPVDGQTPNYMLHHRFFYDPPEFQTVLLGDDKSQHHFGYYRDEPKKDPVFVAVNAAKEGCTITPQGENLFAAVKLHVDKLLKQTKNRTQLDAIKKRGKSVEAWAKKCGHPLEARTPAMKAREKAVVTRTFHKAGLVVPVDSTGVGYRELPETDSTLKKMLKRIVDSESDEERDRHSDGLQEIVTYIQFANDECDYGQGYELGIDLFAFGEAHFHSMIRMLLSVAYQLLGREEFGEILEAHLKDRQRDNVSQK